MWSFRMGGVRQETREAINMMCNGPTPDLNGYQKYWHWHEGVQSAFTSFCKKKTLQTMNGHRHTNTIKSSNQVHWHARCWHEVASLLSRWPCCSWWRGSSLQPSPWMLFWPSLPRSVSGCWASLEPQRTPPVRQSQTAGKQWARCRWPWRRTLWAAPMPRRCTRRTEREQTGCLNKEVRQAILLGRKVGGSGIYKTASLLGFYS